MLRRLVSRRGGLCGRRGDLHVGCGGRHFAVRHGRDWRASEFNAGNVGLTADFTGDGAFAASASASQTVTVAQAASTTTLSLSAAKIVYRHERSERIRVAVSPQFSGTAGGRVTVRAGTATVCTIMLSTGRGSCTLSASKLRAGHYHLVADYQGSADLTASASAVKRLVVSK
jgi:Bacterial Ig-like domain (group 3)